MSTDEVIDKWTRETENYKDISVTMEQGSTTSSSMSSTNQIEVDLQSTDYDALKKASDELVEELRKREDVMQVHSSIENAAPVIKVNVDPVLAQAEGLTPASIGSLIYSNLSGIKATTVRVNGEDTDVRVEFDADKYDSIDKLQGMMITTATEQPFLWKIWRRSTTKTVRSRSSVRISSTRYLLRWSHSLSIRKQLKKM